MKTYLFIFGLLMSMSGAVIATSVYKCTKANGAVMFTDTPCPNMTMQVLHQETEAEAKSREFKSKLDQINYLIQNNQIIAAQTYATEQGLFAYYEKALAAYKIDLDLKQKQEALATQQQQREVEQQRLRLQQQSLQLQALQLEQQRQQATQRQDHFRYTSPLFIQPCAGLRPCGSRFSTPHYWQQPNSSAPITQPAPQIPANTGRIPPFYH